MSLLTSTRTVSFQRTIRASRGAVLKLLHDPDVMFRTNPLITDVIPDPSHASSYTVVDRLVVMGFYKTQTKFHCHLNLREDGLDTDVVANLGTKLRGSYTVNVGDGKTTELVEETVVEGLFFLMPYIVKTMSAAHEAVLENLVAKAENRSSWSLKFLLTSIQSLPMHSQLRPSQENKGPRQSMVLLLMTITVTSLLRYSNIFPMSVAIPTFTILAGALLVNYWTKTTSDPYGLFHLALNRLPGEEESVPPKTEWLNMGFWRSPGASSSLSGTSEEAAIFSGGSATNPDHPLDPSSTTAFDRILALDCAYHFNTRKTFLRQSLQKLAPGGRIALADICFDPEILNGSRKTWLISSLFRLMPKQNMVSTDGYIAQMESMGYIDVELEDITRDVFPGFVRFLSSRGFGWKVFALVIEWYADIGARFVIVSGSSK
ncbi:hypothetical protein H0H81_007494 [Sphagnurus paluster]|uniref:DUF7053 domain-containing protein n=1 Tax=Sphagnurus paluster TaxID=117069 RepID=A0A9P7GRJ2_9AGAR|nr:hypothetical protein H0H81_007494 [Sphagnurus paluster]